MKQLTYAGLRYHLFELLIKLIDDLLLSFYHSISFDAFIFTLVDNVILLADYSFQLIKAFAKISDSGFCCDSV